MLGNLSQASSPALMGMLGMNGSVEHLSGPEPRRMSPQKHLQKVRSPVSQTFAQCQDA